MTLRVAVVGAGLIGRRRAHVAQQAPESTLVVVADVDQERASALAADLGCESVTDWEAVVRRPDVDVVIVAAVNKFLAPISIGALHACKHVLCEKPLGRNAAEAAAVAHAAEASGARLKVGFNHRFHPAIWEAHRLCAEGGIGEPRYVRAAYGHGGRPGYDKEWRGNADLSGGGEVLDQGVHLVDLCRWFLGEFDRVAGETARGFWDIAPLEDNGFALLSADDGRVATFHTSWMQWKNRFLFEVIGTDGYVTVDGLGGSYGPERLIVGRRNPAGGVPAEEVSVFDGPDLSWQEEWRELTAAIREHREPLSSVRDAVRTMQIVDALYRAATTHSVVSLPRD